MPLPIRALTLALAALSGVAAVAQQPGGPPGVVYKIVGPDGKITFSDRPPSDTTQRASIVNRAAASGAVVMPPPVTAITPWASLSADARRGLVPAVPLGETASSPSVVTVSLVDSITTVLARAELVQTMRTICVRAAPSAYSAYDEAARRWQDRNAPVVAQADRVLQSAFDGARRAKLQANAHTRLANILAPLASASQDARIMWCDASTETIGKGGLDMQGAGGVAAPVMNYEQR